MMFNPTALMGNNPMVQMINVMRNGGNPEALIQQMLGNNPQLQQVIAGKSPQQIMQTAETMCRERGTTVNAILNQYGITL